VARFTIGIAGFALVACQSKGAAPGSDGGGPIACPGTPITNNQLDLTVDWQF
jgi:hypothetical protein